MSTEHCLSFFIVDDDPNLVELVSVILQAAGHKVASSLSSVEALERIEAQKPDVVIADIMLPEMDGFQLCKRVKSNPDLSATQVVMLSAKAYDFDKAYATKMGADGYIVKPFNPETLADEMMAIVSSGMTVRYWGVRGTLPVPGEDTLRYGGNTSCVSIEVPNKPMLIFDAGTGIKKLSDYIFENVKGKITAKVFISHPHWDHINALPFFGPMYVPGNEFEILGTRHGDTSMRELISAQMDGIYFPITIREFGARVYFRDLGEETLQVNGMTVKTMLLNHPGNCLGYRVELAGKVVCYITDHELFLDDNPMYNPGYVDHLIAFCHGADILITDTTYADEDYPSKVTWGHSSVGQVVGLAHRAEVKTLHLFHHDPDQDDSAIDAKLSQAQRKLDQLGSSTKVAAPAEGDSISL
ncbi:response regulator [Magnetovibrio sp. PR-2]|uniref:response regulator n=1 Tax=Magnetovibrio sp. PR-2 TaxID=3120356 RepID=UPI002FCE4FCE